MIVLSDLFPLKIIRQSAAAGVEKRTNPVEEQVESESDLSSENFEAASLSKIGSTSALFAMEGSKMTTTR